MPAKKVFETPEEAQQYLEELRRRNRERAKYFYDNKLKLIPKNMKNLKINVRDIVMIIIIKTKNCLLKFKNTLV